MYIMLAWRHARGSSPSWPSADVSGLLHATLLRNAFQGTEVGRKFRIRRWHRASPRIIFTLLFFIVRHVFLHLFVAHLIQISSRLFHPIQAHSLRGMYGREVLLECCLATGIARLPHRASCFSGGLLLYSTALQQYCVVSAVFSPCVYEREVCVGRTVQGLCGPPTALLRGGSVESAVLHYWGTEVVPRDFNRTTARPRTIDYRTIEGPVLYCHVPRVTMSSVLFFLPSLYVVCFGAKH